MLAVTLLVISILLGILPLAGLVFIAMQGMLQTVDGLFMSLILLVMAGVFLLNSYWEMRERGWLKFRRKKAAEPQPAAQQASAQKAQ
jgi:uncharacterized membrane protein